MDMWEYPIDSSIYPVSVTVLIVWVLSCNSYTYTEVKVKSPCFQQAESPLRKSKTYFVKLCIYSWHWLGYLRGTCAFLVLGVVPEEYLHIPNTGQNTCRVPSYPWQLPGHLQGTIIPLTVARAPAGYHHTLDSCQGTCRVPSYPWSGHEKTIILPYLPEYKFLVSCS